VILSTPMVCAAEPCVIARLEALQFLGGATTGEPDPPGYQEWNLLLADSGPAVLEVEYGRGRHEIPVDPTLVSEIQVGLNEAKLLRWPKELGSVYVTPDPARRDLAVTCSDGRSMSVFFYDTEDLDALIEQGASATHVRQSRAFLEIWILIRGLFTDTNALDTREEDRRVLARSRPTRR
jgi:hypothetical protein